MDTFLGVVVGILSLSVAVFVGTQIYQSFTLKRDKKEQVLKLVFGDNNIEILNR